MPNPLPFDFDFAPEALDRALRGQVGSHDDDDQVADDLGDDGELRLVARRIAGGHVEVVARFVRITFAGDATDSDKVQFVTALGSLARLATEVGDTTQAALLGRTREDVDRSISPTGRRLLLARLQRFVEDFAETLEGEDAMRLRELVEYDPDDAPLLAELAGVRGIGPRRLERLFCCGLYTVEAVANARAGEVAAVAGLPGNLAERVVEAAREYAERERTESIRDVRARIQDFRRVVRSLQGPVPQDTVRDATLALHELEQLVAELIQNRRDP